MYGVFHKPVTLWAQGPHSQILLTGGGDDRGSYLIPEKITTSEFVYPKKSLLFIAYPKNSLSPFFARPPKNPSVFFFRDPKKFRRLSQTQKDHFWPKFQTQKSHSDPPPPPVIKICEWGPWARFPAFIVYQMPKVYSGGMLAAGINSHIICKFLHALDVKFVEIKSTELVLKIN